MAKFLSERELEYLENPKRFNKLHGKDYGYAIKSRILKKYREMKKAINHIEKSVDARTLQKLLHLR